MNIWAAQTRLSELFSKKKKTHELWMEQIRGHGKDWRGKWEYV